MNFKEYSFLDKSILIKFPNDWIVKEQDDNLIKVSFPSGPYPTLDCYLSCFDNPKINTEDSGTSGAKGQRLRNPEQS